LYYSQCPVKESLELMKIVFDAAITTILSLRAYEEFLICWRSQGEEE